MALHAQQHGTSYWLPEHPIEVEYEGTEEFDNDDSDIVDVHVEYEIDTDACGMYSHPTGGGRAYYLCRAFVEAFGRRYEIDLEEVVNSSFREPNERDGVIRWTEDAVIENIREWEGDQADGDDYS